MATKAMAARRSSSAGSTSPEDELDSYGDEKKRFLSRQKALEAAMEDINKQFGKGSIVRLGASGGGKVVETIPSGCLMLDYILGGGLPKGRIVEIFGSESSGKTTLALHAIAEVQKRGGNAVLIDAEHAFDPSYSERLGVDIDNLYVCQPDAGDAALEIADRLIRSNCADIICIDSVSALIPRAELEGEIGIQQVGGQARLMSQAARKLAQNASKAGVIIIFLNQIRYKVGVVYGNPETTSGGMALKFYASVRIEVKPAQKIKGEGKGDEDVGIRIRARIVKSKVSRPYRQCEFDIIFGEGISRMGSLVDAAEATEVINRRGSWYSFGEQRLGQGREKVVQLLQEQPDIATTIEQAVLAKMAEVDGDLNSQGNEEEGGDHVSDDSASEALEMSLSN